MQVTRHGRSTGRPRFDIGPSRSCPPLELLSGIRPSPERELTARAEEGGIAYSARQHGPVAPAKLGIDMPNGITHALAFARRRDRLIGSRCRKGVRRLGRSNCRSVGSRPAAGT